MATPTRFDYKRWAVWVKRSKAAGAYEGVATRGGHGPIVTADFYGSGAKARAAAAIKQQIDERDAR